MRYVKWLAGHNDALPTNARRLVHVIWVLPTFHKNYPNNEKRKIFANALVTKSKLQEKQHAFELRQLWEPEDNNIFLKTEKRFSSFGIDTFFKAFDRTVMFANSVANKSKGTAVIPFPVPPLGNDNMQMQSFRAPAQNKKLKKNTKVFWKYHSKGYRLPKPQSGEAQPNTDTDEDM